MKDLHESLKLIDVDQIDIHETYEPSRLEKTKESIETDQFIRHPILVVPMNQGRYMVIDGVHRFTSLKALGCKVIPVQVIHQAQYSIEAWCHKVPCDQLTSILSAESDLPWTTEIRYTTPFITMCYEDIEQYLYPEDLSTNKMNVWEKVVESYSSTCQVERVLQDACTCITPREILMKYQPLQFSEIEAIVRKGKTVPAGVTRFNIAGRCLNLQVPLKLLKEKYSASQLKAWQQFLHDKVTHMRCYNEKVYLIES
ncbi:siderophore staphylobactin biosynthesis protein SbnI [Staphylococcus schleiferi]|uniref:Bifunctional transcriptional regulator/O-phospho-L-serine synthase SbnI n=1 Tax=Staphylococcus coagulans TaxID=74706 RepID=A0ABU1EWT6_9STAP|nr:bifunctional transcriptional regulator/O-phospho-L-serine synthase SbnI [Staphylococcus coagulans]MDR5602585.1 bifunctional transcriptional regulator/O-phospho-L-serine synthase SbnI [Staphylococcus coagulans]MDR9833074.1 bifunctional transcriptional regulator/O-phospho-L-serine synthase SbnI [Staphylococcus coagulans]PNZ10452.1 siderophore biosynthesis protein SbnI [Staphylococcus coagulans]BAS44917.1 siderophore staphylobactin biosynthesis protein SbnI [Staphylococcus schleiferi]